MEDWAKRQQVMEGWYREFSLDQDKAQKALAYEYRPYLGDLQSLSGRVIDVGGGPGFAGRYMSPSVDYHVVDPSPIWSEAVWNEVAAGLSRTGAAPTFTRAFGESLPFDNNTFDAAVSFWSLNHAADAKACLDEIYRVLKPDAPALLVLEDMVPAWRDILLRAYQEFRRKRHPAIPLLNWNEIDIDTALEAVKRKLLGPPWPLQPDHTRIVEGDLAQWIFGRFTIAHRFWSDSGYLSYRLRRS